MKTIFSDEYRIIVKRLKDARKAKGFSQAQLAHKLKASQSYISKLEQGQVRIDIVQLKKLSKILSVDVKDFLK
jgi:transcriptional regulator with XRE-family HTH domain